MYFLTLPTSNIDYSLLLLWLFRVVDFTLNVHNFRNVHTILCFIIKIHFTAPFIYKKKGAVSNNT